MQVSVNLQGMFSYSVLLLIFLLALVLAPPIFWLAFNRRLIKHPRKASPKPRVRKTRVDLPSLRRKYLEAINEIERRHTEGTIDDREAYLQLSSSVRGFVEDASGIPARNMTLSDLRRHELPGMVGITGLVEKFYDPEFSAEGESDDTASDFRDARTVVSSWN